MVRATLRQHRLCLVLAALAGSGLAACASEPPTSTNVTLAEVVGAVQPVSAEFDGAYPSVEAVHSTLARGFASAVQGNPFYPAYEQCAATSGGRAQCLGPLSNVLYDAIAHYADAFLAKQKNALATMVLSQPQGDYESRAVMLYSTAVDEYSRIAALMLLRRNEQSHDGMLPESAYLSLNDKSDPEIQLVLQGNRVRPLPTLAAKDSVFALASDPSVSSRVRFDAFRALAHPEDAPYVDRLATALAKDDPMRRIALPQSLAGCASACESTLLGLVTDHDTDDRNVALRALAFLPKDQLSANLMASGGLTDADRLSLESVVVGN